MCYATSKDNQHWLWGDNDYGQCELKGKKDRKKNIQPKPMNITKKFYKKTNCMIKDVYIAIDNVFVIGVR